MSLKIQLQWVLTSFHLHWRQESPQNTNAWRNLLTRVSLSTPLPRGMCGPSIPLFPSVLSPTALSPAAPKPGQRPIPQLPNQPQLSQGRRQASMIKDQSHSTGDTVPWMLTKSGTCHYFKEITDKIKMTILYLFNIFMQQLSLLSKILWHNLNYANSIHYMENYIYIRKQVKSYKCLKYCSIIQRVAQSGWDYNHKQVVRLRPHQNHFTYPSTRVPICKLGVLENRNGLGRFLWGLDGSITIQSLNSRYSNSNGDYLYGYSLRCLPINNN